MHIQIVVSNFVSLKLDHLSTGYIFFIGAVDLLTLQST